MTKIHILRITKRLTLMSILFFVVLCGRVFSAPRYKILHVMSYHLPWEWTDDLNKGFKDGLSGLDYEFEVYQMDTKRRSSQEWKEQASKEARNLIETWKPDLVYATDDNAQKYVVTFYINKDIPFVFSAVNADPELYGFVGSKNVTGVLEQEHSVETVRLLREIAPGVKKITIIYDDDPTWPNVVKRMKEKINRQFPDLQLQDDGPIVTFVEFKQRIENCQKTADALALLGIHTFKDENGQNIAWQDVLKWVAENSRLPDFSFWKDRIPCGTLCAVYVSGYEQGLAAGKVAKGILAEGRNPATYSMEPTLKGKPIINLARAKELGLKIKSSVLLTAEVVDKMEWKK